MIRLLLTMAMAFAMFGCKQKTLFRKIESSHSNIHFKNTIDDNDSVNVLDVENIYNGGGIGIADFNNDGLQDIYFTGNMVSNKLYLNKGDFKFEDITASAGVEGEGKWCRGVSVVDINNDGLQDIHVSATIKADPADREDMLYINKGLDAKGAPVFANMAKQYGLNDSAHSTMAAFFDYDNDGDLDMYLLVNEIRDQEFPNQFKPVFKQREHPNTDKLFRNDYNAALGHPVFTDVSLAAGINFEGYGHGVTVCDINRDGWKDVYVTNDFIPQNLLYINNKNGTFTNKEQEYFKHTSSNAMGQDVVDINNDGLADVIELDMSPEDNYRKKTMLNPISYHKFQLSDAFGLQYQYVRNTLQINQGNIVLENDTIGHPIFSDVGFYAGLAETDWSWTPLVADFDNDGFRDIIVTNGFPKDVTDNDFIAFRNKAMSLVSRRDLLDEIPEVKIFNYAFKNTGGIRFTNVSEEWGLTDISFSNGAAWADFDNDGDLDWVVNNIEDEAFLYENLQPKETAAFLQVTLEGDTMNLNGHGTLVELYYDSSKLQAYETSPYRGYLSSVQNMVHFGLGATSTIDSLIVTWPNGKRQALTGIKPNSKLLVSAKDANMQFDFTLPGLATQAWFRDISNTARFSAIHHDSDYIDFNLQRLLPHKFSEYGPALAAGDINGDGLDDVVAGGSYFYPAQFFLQQPDGRFTQRSNLITDPTEQSPKMREDMGVLLFDADNDGDNDLYIASGGYEAKRGTRAYADRFYINDGKGHFTVDTTAFPQNLVSNSCVRAADIDRDGDLDVLVAGRVDPWNYPKAVATAIYRNDSGAGNARFTDATSMLAPALLDAGMVCDMLFTDFDDDGWVDIIYAAEWQSLQFLKNIHGKFSNVSATSGISMHTGWWNSISAGDFDNDGDMDYIAGNLGLNSYYKASDKHPVRVIGNDLDKNGVYDALLSLYLPVSSTNRELKEYPAQLKDDITAQLPSARKQYLLYNIFAGATMQDFLSAFDTTGSLRLHATQFASAVLLNEGNGRFKLNPLPEAAQWSVLNGMVIDDFDADGNLDVILNANDFGTEINTGRYDAMNGLLLKGGGDGNFTPLRIVESGIYIPGNGKALCMLQSATRQLLIAASQNKGTTKLFTSKSSDTCLKFLPADVSLLLKYRNGTFQKRELTYGSSFLSQSARIILLNRNIAQVEIADSKGQKRTISY